MAIFQLILIKPLKNLGPRRFRHRLEEKEKKLIYGGVLELLIPGFFSIYPALIFNFQNPLFTTVGEVFSIGLILSMSFMTFILLPVLVIYSISLKKSTLEEQWYQEKYGYLNDNISPNSKLQRSYFGFFILMRLILLSIVFLFSDTPCIQLQLYLITCIIFFTYTGTKPRLTRSQNKL